MRLDWENEVEVIKQSSGVAIYMLPNMFAVMGLCVLSVFLGRLIDQTLLAAITIAVAAVMASVCYSVALSLAKRS